MKLLKISSIIFGVLLCTACETNYRFTPPDSESGKACITKCMTQDNICRDHQRKDEARCEKSSKEDYERCLRNFSQSANSCVRRDCSISSNYTCTETYQACYQQCGGKVEVIK